MRPPWRRYSKKDPALVPAVASTPSSSVSRFVDLRARKRTAVFCVTATAHTWIPHRDSRRLPLRGACSCSLVVSPKPGMHRPFSNTSGFNGERYPADNVRSIKRIRRKLLAWVDAKGTSRGTRYANAEFLKILRNILLAGNFPAGILCPQKLPPPNFRKV